MKPNYTLRTFGNYDPDKASDESALEFDLDEEPSYTQQQFKEESDINEIMRRFGQGETIGPDYRTPLTGDFTGITDFTTAMQRATEAQSNFMQLPADLRERFANDPQRLLNFVSDEANRDEGIKLGLINAPPEKTRDVIQAIDEMKAALTPQPPKT